MERMKSEILKAEEIEDVRCPICGGEVNQVWFKSIVKRKGKEFAFFIAECWNPLSPEHSRYHKFKLYFELVGEVDVGKNGKIQSLSYNESKQLKCPRCGAPILVTHYGNVWLKCPQCGESFKPKKKEVKL
jgi:ribosomal protein S27AE